MSQQLFIRIREWGRYQHYKDRNPPWIKLHRELLTSLTWALADDASRVLAIACMMIAAATDNKIPASAEYVKRVAYLHNLPDFSQLEKLEFIEFIDVNGKVVPGASKLLALARPETETETETETEDQNQGAKPKSPAPRSLRLVQLPKWIPGERFDGWLEMRKKIRKPATDQAQKLAVKKLDSLRSRGHPPGEVLDQSILNGWQDLFEIRSNGNGKQQFSKATTRDREILERAIRSATASATGATPGESADPLEVPRNGGT